MNQINQTRTGKDGNCWSACLASIFEVPIEEVEPCACNHEDWWEQTRAFLRRYDLWNLEIKAVRDTDGSLKEWPFVAPPDGSICVLKGQSINGLPHVVVAETRISPTSHLEFVCLHDPLGIGESVLTTAEVAIFFVQKLKKYKPPLLIK